MSFSVYFWLGPVRVHPHILFGSLAYAIALRLLFHNAHKDSISSSQRSSVIVGGMVGALAGAKGLVLLQQID